MSHIDGARIRQRREKANLSQVAAARITGIDQSEWSKIENNRSYLGPVRARRIADVFGCPIDEL